MSKKDITMEVQSMLRDFHVSGGWQVAKKIVALASESPETWRQIGANHSGAKRPMSQAEASRIVAMARLRIEAADADE